MKGESSGHTQVQDISFDCDRDTLLIQVSQVGAACHEGYRSCFYRSVGAQGDPNVSPNPNSGPGPDLRPSDGRPGSIWQHHLLPAAGHSFRRPGADFLSTWIATPNLVLEANISKSWDGRGDCSECSALNGFALWPLPSIGRRPSLLVAARNFQSAWLMRSLAKNLTVTGSWNGCGNIASSLCLLAQSGLVGGVSQP
ncbi:MAG: phosphoribosyl-AMP cyclohydrolase [Verrucomicrobiota bacterium]